MARSRSHMSLASLGIALLAALLFGPEVLGELGWGGASAPIEEPAPVPARSERLPARGDAAEQAILDAFAAGRSDILVEGEGTVEAVLRDDKKGSRHQRFILALPTSGHSLLIAHNIDLAPRIPDLRRGERVAFRGEYEWNERGGVIHWTHHDPAGRHPGGWLQHDGRRYE